MTPLPKPEEIDEVLKAIEGVIGLSAACPQTTRYYNPPSPSQTEDYLRQWKTIDLFLTSSRNQGFPITHWNPHQDLTSMWAWCWTIEGGASKRMHAVRENYIPVIETLGKLKDAVSNRADSTSEALRDLRESRVRTNELFVIMPFRQETDGYYSKVILPASAHHSLKPVRIDSEEPDTCINEAILSSIRRALIVACDLSFARPNCYFEAGYALGSFRRIIFTARYDHDPRKQSSNTFKVHFDVDAYKITWWNPDDYEAAQCELQTRLGQVLSEVRTP